MDDQSAPTGLVFTSRSGAAVRRTTFRAKVWRPSLVRAGLLGKIVEVGEHKLMAHWHDSEGHESSKELTAGREAIEHLVRHAHGGLRFHDSATPTPPGWSRPACRSTTSPRSWDTSKPRPPSTATPTHHKTGTSESGQCLLTFC